MADTDEADVPGDGAGEEGPLGADEDTEANTEADTDAEADAEEHPFAKRRFVRSGTGLEFDRFTFFNDAIFAIALTIIVVSIGVPHDVHPESSIDSMLAALNQMWDSFYGFFLAFVIIGRFWLANHRLLSTFAAVDSTFMSWSLLYLASVAFLPFPAALMGQYTSNPVAVSFFAVSLAFVCALEAVQLLIAQRHALLKVPLSPEAFRWSMIAQLVPVGVFLLSLPLIFLNTYLGMTFWLTSFVIETFLDRRKPDEFVLKG